MLDGGRQKRVGQVKKRRKTGDKSRNDKAATIVTLYTLKKGRNEKSKAVLLGPINNRSYVPMGPNGTCSPWPAEKPTNGA